MCFLLGFDSQRAMGVQVKLLGLSLVVWSDSTGTNWHCLEDKCSHRLAPLSEGRIEGGHVMCCYHGWTFNGEGQCTKIPQILDSKAQSFACSQPSSRIKVYPTQARKINRFPTNCVHPRRARPPLQVKHGLLWVWPESGLSALSESEAAPIRIAWPQDTEQAKWALPYTWFVRDLPLRYDTTLENLIDMSHAPHAHHGVPGMGNRNKPPVWTYTKDSPSTQEEGLCVSLKGPLPFDVKFSFKPPVFIR